MRHPLRKSVSWLAIGLAVVICTNAPVCIAGDDADRRVTLELDVLPILTSAGCNAGACHGKSGGQNGFQLSLLGFNPDFDDAAITKQARGRRVFPAAPEHSLLLLKPSAQVPHGGGKRIEPDGPQYATLYRWIANGMPRSDASDPKLVGITVAPPEQVMEADSTVQLTVTSHYSDGSTRDVTPLTNFQSNESAIASVDKAGWVKTANITGEATIMARYMDEIAAWSTAVPVAGTVDGAVYDQLPRFNFIDELVWEKLRALRITPSDAASDSTFLRRATLDIIGRVPTADEVRRFLADPDPKRREKLVGELLERPEYADYWANKWADLLRPNPYRVGIKATFNLDAWLRDAFRRNMPYDQFVHELLTAEGSTWRNGAVTVFRDRRSPDEITTMVSQLFLGIRLECAKCHHHPFEVWGQDHFYSLAAYFARVGRKGSGLSPPISGGEEIVYTAASGSVTHPLTGAVMTPQPLFGEAREIGPDEDPREALVEWMRSPENKYFAQVAVNRVWADMMGRGLVEPVDDLRDTNPPSNPALLDALADDFRQGGFDLKHLIRSIATSYVYQLSSLPNERNVADTRNYSRHYRQRLRAEVLYDAICDITDYRERFDAMPSGGRAIEIWTHRIDSTFLDAFGRPDANQDPPCERTGETTMVQSLHLMNAPALHEAITSDTGRAARWAAADTTPGELVAELYLTVYSRYPTAEELEAASNLFQNENADRRRLTEDLLWAMINSPEFIFKN